MKAVRRGREDWRRRIWVVVGSGGEDMFVFGLGLGLLCGLFLVGFLRGWLVEWRDGMGV